MTYALERGAINISQKNMKTCLLILALAAFVTAGCQSDTDSDMSANDKYMNLQPYPADVAPPLTNMPPMNSLPPP